MTLFDVIEKLSPRPPNIQRALSAAAAGAKTPCEVTVSPTRTQQVEERHMILHPNEPNLNESHMSYRFRPSCHAWLGMTGNDC